MRDPELFLARLWQLDQELVRVGWPETSPWWRREIERFFRSGRRRWVLRVGRRGGKSSTLCRVAVAWALFGEWDVPPGDTAVIPFVSIDRREAGGRLRTILEILEVLGVARRSERGETITIKSRERPLMFSVVTCSVSGTVGFTSVAVFADEMARWESKETSANPAKEVMGSLRPTMATQRSAFEACSSSPFGEVDYHHDLFKLGDDDHQCTAHAATWEANPTITEEETRHDEPDQTTWLREYAAIPSKGVKNNWFGEAVDAALTDDPPPAIGSGQRPVIAIDPAFAHDYFGWCVILSEQSDHVDAVTGRRYRRTWVQQAGAWKPEGTPRETLRRLWREIALPAWRASGQDGMPRVVSDQFEGFSLTELARDVGIALEVVPWTGGSGENAKLTKFKAVRTAMRESAFLVPREHPVVKEFRSVRGVLTQSGLERIEYARTGDGHLDMLSAVVLGGSVALERMPRAVDPVPVVLDEGARMRAERIREVEKRQKQQWDRDPRHAMRQVMRR